MIPSPSESYDRAIQAPPIGWNINENVACAFYQSKIQSIVRKIYTYIMYFLYIYIFYIYIYIVPPDWPYLLASFGANYRKKISLREPESNL